MESRFRNTIKNSYFAIINQIASLLLNIVSRTIFINILGVEYLGISGLFSDVLILLSLSDLGLETAMVYSYYKPFSENDKHKIIQLTQLYKKIYSIIIIVVFIIGLSITPYLKYLISSDLNISDLYIYYFLLLGNTLASYLYIYKSSVLSASQKNYIISKCQTIFNFTKLFLQIIILIITKSYALYLIIQIITTVLNNIVLSNITNKLYPYINDKTEKMKAVEKKSIYENVKSMFLYKISIVFFSGTDNTLISVLVGTVWVGYYSNYNIVINAINGFVNVIYNSATASIGNVIVSDIDEKKYHVFKYMQLFSFVFSTVTTVCLLTLFSNFIYIWIGNSFVLSNNILYSIILNFYFNNIIHPIWSFREACGLYQRTKYIMVYAAVINFILSIILGLKFGISGILFASLFARLCSYFWYEPKILFNEYFNQTQNKFYIPLLKNFLFTLLFCLFMKFLFDKIIIITWTGLFLKSLVVFIVACIVTLLFYCKDEDFILIINNYLKKMK